MSEIVTAPRIVVGVDGSACSTLALHWARRLARAEHATIDVVGAWEYPIMLGWDVPLDDYSPELDMQTTVSETVEKVFGPQHPPYVHVSIRKGHPVRVLLNASADALMLVVGSRGRGGFAGLLLGSVSARVAELATCPVLVVRGSTPDAEEVAA